MPKIIFRTLVYVFLGMIIGGCASVKARGYVETRKRVDQEIDGNAGYLKGTPPEPTAPTKKTRDVYVLEITQKTPDEDEPMKSTAPEPLFQHKTSLANEMATAPVRNAAPTKNFSATPLPAESKTSPPQSTFTPLLALPAQYTVGKDDTLQTISKKFYNSYSKWPRIYEANKDKISDPNRIKTGIVLTIPTP